MLQLLVLSHLLFDFAAELLALEEQSLEGLNDLEEAL
jgi:hypothetical protein